MRRSRSILAVGVAAATAVVGLVTVTPADAASTTVVVNEVYGGGGNSGAPLKNDFVELRNDSASTLDLTGWSVQYISGTPTSTTVWQVTALTGSVAGGDTYLIGEGAGGGSGVDLPPTNATGTIAMSATNGTIALVHDTTARSCKTSVDCAADPSIVDLVGYGTATIAEASPASGASNTASVQRSAGPDTDNNSTDFTAGAPTPTGSPSGPPPPPSTRIHDIQGAGFVSPLAGQSVTGVRGIVTGVRTTSSRGFWMQDPDADADPATSEGIFVFTSSAPPVAVGDEVAVSGTVSDFYPGGAPSTNSNLSVTEIGGSPSVVTISAGNPLPAPVVLGPSNVPDVYAPDLGGANIETSTLNPARSALDFYESLEGMRVAVQDARVVGPSNSFGEQYVTSRPNQAPTYRGGTELLGENQTPSGRLEVIPADGSNPGVDVNDVLQGATVGPMDYSAFGGYVLEATQLGTVVHNNLPRVVATAPAAHQISIATYNVENLAPSDPLSKYQVLAQGVVTNLRSPDILAIEEVQDNSGASDNGVVAADQTLTNLTQAITAAGGPTYSWREIDPVNDKDGGQPGGNIRVAFLYNPSQVSFVDAGSASVNRSVTGTQVVKKGGASLTLSPGRIDPTNPVWNDSRKPLVGQFRAGGHDVFVVANHFDSKLGDENADGRFQYPERSSELQRAGQALVVHDFVNSLLAAKPDAEAVVLGDLNDYQFSPALNVLRTGTADGTGDSTLTDLITTLPVDQQYTYVFDGISQVLDHILVTRQIKKFSYQVVHLNAEYHDQASDHDPQVVQFQP